MSRTVLNEVAQDIVMRAATEEDHEALIALEGTAPNAGAELLQARRNFFARTDAYPSSRVLVVEHDGVVVGVECVAMTEVRIAGGHRKTAYSFNTRVVPGLQRRRVGPGLIEAAEQWALDQGASYFTGLIKTTNAPSMKMVTAMGFETIGRFDYLVLDLARFEPERTPRAVQFDLYRDPHLMRLRLAAVQSHHFVPVFLERELFSPPPEGAYTGSWTAGERSGTAWLSLWDDRPARRLDPFAFRAVKAFDIMLEGPEALDAFTNLAGVLRLHGVRQLLVPLPAESAACAM
ncbi:MAG TPA: GNAT family N-acetyltransferase, partial [Verrucomicrobiae bacterium]|nr:GNAT family N-acetyltransferase [Verrucomicrobiae bacterium]